MLQRYDTINALLDDVFTRFAQRPAYTCAGHTINYAELDALSLQFARYLQCHLTLSPGDRIAIQLPNILQYPVVIYGAVRAGLVLVNTNPLYSARELEHQLRDSGAKVLVVLSNVAHTAAQIIRNTAVEHVIVTDFADLMPWPKRPLINFVIRHIKKMVPPYHFDGAISLRSALALGQTGTLKPLNVNSETLLCLQYTGGTTGVAKGAMLSHGNLASNAWQVWEHMSDLTPQAHAIFAAPLPLYHIYAFCLHAVGAVSIGAMNILIPNPRDIPATVKALAPFKFTVFIGLTTLFKALCRNEDFKKLDFSGLVITASGGMALTSDAFQKWLEVTGCEICEGYGLTEASPVISSTPRGAVQAGTIGTLLAETQAKIIDDNGQDVASGGKGELCVKGPQVMQGYWQNPRETALVFTPDGWLKTGDIAEIHSDGYIKLVDRKKDMILVSGFNVYPNELEDVLNQMPGILEAAAIGIPDEKTGEAIKIFVVRSDNSLNEQAILDYCRERLTNYKVPKFVAFCPSLPKSNVGKILRRELRASTAE